MKTRNLILALTTVLTFSQCTSTRYYTTQGYQRPRQSKESLRHDQKVGIIGSVPVVVIMYLFLSATNR